MNDREFERIFRDRLYDQSYPPRPQLWKQLRLRWRNRIAARQWRWFYSASVVAVMVMAAMRAGKPATPSVTLSTPVTGAAVMAAASTSREATSTSRAATAMTAMAPAAGKAPVGVRARGERGKAGALRRRGGTGRQAADGLGPKGGRQGAADGVTDVEADGAADGAKVPASRNGERMGVQLPRLAQLATRAGVQVPARAKAAHVSLPGRPRKDAEPAWNGWSGEVYGSPDIPTSQFNFSWTAGFRVSRIFAAHYSITTGLQYSTVNVQRGDWAATVLYPPRFNNLDLPVLLGYSTRGQRVRLSAYAGGIINLYSHATGNPGFPWPNHAGQSAYLGLDLAYRLDERWALFAQPYGRCLFSSPSKSLFPGQMITEGALLGLRYRFNP